ncbi:MAG TPA: hypothetical protein VG733_08200 [Chthoniobacteraceae bacterium]|nr:hypothetical protein [Chthoniobacteraceae bacterium]
MKLTVSACHSPRATPQLFREIEYNNISIAKMMFVLILVLVGSGCATKDWQQVETIAEVPASITSDGSSKLFHWNKINVSDCHQINGTLVLHNNGTALFSCVTWTTSKESSKNYWCAFKLPSGISLNRENPSAPGQYFFHRPMATGAAGGGSAEILLALGVHV